MNIFQLSLLFAILLKCVIASENVAPDVLEALSESEKENGFEKINGNLDKWYDRNDLFDCVATKDIDFIVGFINRFRDFEIYALAALFIKRPEKVDQVLERVIYSDDDLMFLTAARPELAQSHESFFKAIGKIKNIASQEDLVQRSVRRLLEANKHDHVIPLINALQSSTLNIRLKDIAIRQAFYEGAERGIKDIVETLHEHPAIMSGSYVTGLSKSWGNPTIFQFLLSRADQGDLAAALQSSDSRITSEFRKAIDRAFSKAPHAGIRHARFLEKTLAAKKFSSDTLIVFPPPIEVQFDSNGLPILHGFDPTKVPFKGLSILERVERAKRLKELQQKREAEESAQKKEEEESTITITPGTAQVPGTPPTTETEVQGQTQVPQGQQTGQQGQQAPTNVEDEESEEGFHEETTDIWPDLPQT
jgi:hypothetical protein